MGKKMKLIPFLSRSTSAKHPTNTLISSSSSASASASSQWQWPSCGNIQTLSFRAAQDDIFRMVNSSYEEPSLEEEQEGEESCRSFSTATEIPCSSSSRCVSVGVGTADPVEAVIKGGLRSDRLFFRPGQTNSILEEATTTTTTLHQHNAFISSSTHNNNNNKINNNIHDVEIINNGLGSGSCSGSGSGSGSGPVSSSSSSCTIETPPYKESVIMSMDSKDPYVDFRRSMEEMVEAHNLKDWEGLEELLSCYLKVNGKSNHGFIVGAFIDLLVNLSFVSCSISDSTNHNSSSSANCCSSGSGSSSFSISHSSPCSSPLSLPCSPLRTAINIREATIAAAATIATTTTTDGPCLASLLDLDRSGGRDEHAHHIDDVIYGHISD